MKIIHIASGDLWAGAEVQLYNLAISLAQLPRMDVEVVLLNHGELASRLRRAGLAVSVLDERRLGALRIGWRLMRHLRRQRPHIVHTHRQKENVLGSIAALLAGVPSLRSVHGLPEQSPPLWRLDKRLYRLLDRLCGRYLQRCLVAVSGELGEQLARRFPPKRIAVIDNGVDPGRLMEAAAAEIVVPGAAGRLRIAMVGRLVPVKRADLFLQVARQLSERRPGGIDFYIIGDGPGRADCVRMIHELGLAGRVHLLGFLADVAPLLARMDLLLITSDHEGLPMTLLEAMSLGVPVVASAVGGMPDVLAQGQCGLLVRQQRPEAYVAATLPLLDDPAARGRLARRAKERVVSRYSAARNAEQHVALYRRLRPDGASATTGQARPAIPSEDSRGAQQ